MINWIEEHPDISDFSTEVLPSFMGRIATWNNNGIHRDIGVLPMLKLAQSDSQQTSCWAPKDAWQTKFLNHPIQKQIEQAEI